MNRKGITIVSIIAIAVGIVAIFFALQNAQPVDVNLLLFGKTSGSLAFFLISAFLLGSLLLFLLVLPGILKRKNETVFYKNRLEKLEKIVEDELLEKESLIKELASVKNPESASQSQELVQ